MLSKLGRQPSLTNSKEIGVYNVFHGVLATVKQYTNCVLRGRLMKISSVLFRFLFRKLPVLPCKLEMYGNSWKDVL